MNSAYVVLCLTPVFTALSDSTYSIQKFTWTLHLRVPLFLPVVKCQFFVFPYVNQFLRAMNWKMSEVLYTFVVYSC